jgi:hypothetical protein
MSYTHFVFVMYYKDVEGLCSSNSCALLLYNALSQRNANSHLRAHCSLLQIVCEPDMLYTDDDV